MPTKILIVEDEAITSIDIKHTLERMDFEIVSIVSEGKKAIQKAEELKPDLILMDIFLKGEMDGIEAADKIMTFLDIPVIYLTALSDKKTFERAKLTKPYGFLTKPIDSNELKATIEITIYKHKLDKKIKESEEKYQLLYQDAPLPYQSLNESGHITEVNQAWLNTLGYSKDEVIGKWFGDFLKPNSTEKFMEKFPQFKAEGEICNIELEMKRKDGSTLFTEFNGKIKRDANGNFQRTQCIFQDITKQIKAERKLNESKERYKLFFNNPLMGFALCEIITDTKGEPVDFVYLKVNQAFEDLTGLKKEEVLNKKVTDVLIPEEVAEIIQIYGKVALTGESTVFQYPIPSLNKYYEVSAFQPENKQFIAFFTDITERKKAEEELKQAHDNLEENVKERTNELYNERQRLFGVLETLPVMICLLTSDHNVKFANRAFRERFGESKGRYCYEYCFGNKESCEFCESFKPLETGEPHYWQVKSPDGSIIDVYDFPFTDIDGSQLILKMEIDVTEQKQAEEAIKAERQRFTDVMEILPAYLILLKQDYHVEYANRFFRERFGEDCGKRCYEYLFGLSEPCENCETFKVLKTNAPHQWEWTGPDGRNYDIYDFPFRDTDGSLLIMEFGIDITERKKAEEQLKESIIELKHSNKELQQFAYVSSHDLQEPLRTIASFTQLLQLRYKGKFDSDADEFMEYTVEAAVRMKAQIEGLLEYSRVGTQGKEFKPVVMNEILNQTIGNLHTSIEESKAKITFDKLPTIMGDADQLQRVFQNLISNAIRFRKCEEPPKISISANKNIYDNEYVFSVKDNGIGIEEQYSERIFTIFQRLHTRNVYKGTGIGLSIVKRVIERHGGHIWVESSFGKGSTFYFTIPVENGGGAFPKIWKSD